MFKKPNFPLILVSSAPERRDLGRPWMGGKIPFPKPSFTLCQEELVPQSCPILCDPMDYSLPSYSVHGILQARILEWVAISSSRGSSQVIDQTQVYPLLTHTFQTAGQDLVQFSHSVMSDSLRPHEPQNARHACPSPTPRVYPDPCPLSW